MDVGWDDGAKEEEAIDQHVCPRTGEEHHREWRDCAWSVSCWHRSKDKGGKQTKDVDHGDGEALENHVRLSHAERDACSTA